MWTLARHPRTRDTPEMREPRLKCKNLESTGEILTVATNFPASLRSAKLVTCAFIDAHRGSHRSVAHRLYTACTSPCALARHNSRRLFETTPCGTSQSRPRQPIPSATTVRRAAGTGTVAPQFGTPKTGFAAANFENHSCPRRVSRSGTIALPGSSQASGDLANFCTDAISVDP
jgi:hypothetical protein